MSENASRYEWKDIGEYGMTPKWVLLSGVSRDAKALYALLALYAHYGTVRSKAQLGEDLGCAKSSVERYLDELVTIGALEVVPQRTETGGAAPNLYLVAFVDPKKRPTGEEVPPDLSGHPPPDGSGSSRAREDKTDLSEALEPSEEHAQGHLMDDVATVYDYWRAKRSKTRANYDEISPGRRKKIEARLKEFNVDELLKAIDGVCVDEERWPERARYDDFPVIFRSREQVDRFIEIADRAPVGMMRPRDIAGLEDTP